MIARADALAALERDEFDVVVIGGGERVLGLLHLGTPRQEQRTPERAPVDDYVEHLA